MRTFSRFIWRGGLAAGVFFSGHAVAAEDDARAAFFETRVRPVLAEHCYPCHGVEKQRGGLRVDHGDLLLKGGDNGAALAPGMPDASRLLAAISYANVDLQMPPDGRLPESAIADLRAWIAEGAYWPAEPVPSAKAVEPAFDLAGRRARHWAWQPIQPTAPPAVRDAAWPRGAVDAFVLARLEAAGLRPAPEAERLTLLRRVSYDLTGLPPTPEEAAAYLADPSPQAYERAVDRLLASPQFGEHWARHWLDVTRYAETYGFEGDFDIPHAWQYRDYVIRALNADVPYDQFVREHLAGDLLPEPRRNTALGFNESVIGTGAWLMHQAQHAPVDVRMDCADRIDNQIDVMGKALLGLTVSCARCHDHKFDAISAADYYALAGFFRSARQDYTEIDPGGKLADAVASLRTVRAEGEATLTKALEQATVRASAVPAGDAAFRLAADVQPAPSQSAAPSVPPEGFTLFEDFAQDLAGWYPSGEAFGVAPTGPAAWARVGEQLRFVPAGVAHSGLLSPRVRGALRSQTFPLEHDYVFLRAAGTGGRLRLVIEQYALREIVDLLFEKTLIEVNHGVEFRWFEMSGLAKYRGCNAYFELIDPGDGFLAVDTILFGNAPLPTEFSEADPAALPNAATPEAWMQALAAWRTGTTSQAALAPLNAAVDRLGLPVEAYLSAAREADAAVPAPVQVLALAEGNGVDAPLYVRGNPKTPGAPVPRRFLEAIDPAAQPMADAQGSGRLALAERVLDPANPLTSRVYVNRVWSKLFGRGIVPSVDNFGALGQPPSHPELLDYLATQFRAQGWSTKQLIRELVCSATYRMASAPGDLAAESADPANALLHRMPLRRLQAESIRDAILAVAGTLNTQSGGPSVKAYISPFMGGFRKPATSGPMDGDRRRSIYQEMRRNFLPAFLQAFDLPSPDTTHGQRNVSNVPAQAMVLMNDPFVAAQAEAWANSVLAVPRPGAEARIEALYWRAFTRAPKPEEVARGMAYLRAQAEALGVTPDEALRDARAWTGYCHALFTLKEFIFIG